MPPVELSNFEVLRSVPLVDDLLTTDAGKGRLDANVEVEMAVNGAPAKPTVPSDMELKWDLGTDEVDVIMDLVMHSKGNLKDLMSLYVGNLVSKAAERAAAQAAAVHRLPTLPEVEMAKVESLVSGALPDTEASESDDNKDEPAETDAEAKATAGTPEVQPQKQSLSLTGLERIPRSSLPEGERGSSTATAKLLRSMPMKKDTNIRKRQVRERKLPLGRR